MSKNCALCKNEDELKSSHIISKFIYKFMRKYQDSINDVNGLITIDAKTKTIDVTQRQWKEKLLCNTCEGVLSKNESKMAIIMRHINSLQPDKLMTCFYMNDYSTLNIPKEISSIEISEATSSSYIDEEKAMVLKFFSISYLLRHLYVIDNTLNTEIIDKLESYILGESEFNVQLVIKINSAKPWTMFSSVVCLDSLDRYKHYVFMLPNMWFHLIFDQNNCQSGGKDTIAITPENFYKDDHILKIMKFFHDGNDIKPKAIKAFSNISPHT